MTVKKRVIVPLESSRSPPLGGGMSLDLLLCRMWRVIKKKNLPQLWIKDSTSTLANNPKIVFGLYGAFQNTVKR